MPDQPIQVLLIEDNPTDVLLLAEALAEVTSMQFRLTEVEGLAEGLQRLRESSFDVVLLDLGLPDSQGLETFIKVYRQVPGVPIVVLSGLVDEALSLSAVQAGAQDYLVKGQTQGQELARVIRYAIERKRAEEKLRRSETVLAQAGQMAHLGAWEIEFNNDEDVNANPLRWSDEVYRIFGYQPGTVEVSNELFFERVHPEDRPRIVAAVAQALAEKRPYQIEHRIIRPDGVERFVLEHAEITFDPQGRPLHMIGAVQDITERKQAEERFRLVVEASPNAIMLVNREHQITLVNARAETLFGYTREELIGQPIELLIPPPLRPQHRHNQDSFFKAPRTRPMCAGRDLFGWRKDGRQVPVDIGLSPVETPEGVFVLTTIIDITERKQAEAALREREHRYRTIGETIPYGVWLTDAVGYCTYVSDSFLELVSMTLEQVQQFGWLHLLPPEDVQPTQNHWLQCVQTGANFEREHRFRTPDGGYRHVLAIGRPVRDERGQITCWVGLNLDITERKQAEEAIRASKAKLEAALASMTDAVFISDTEGRFVEFNDAFATFHKFKNKQECLRTLAEYPEILDVFMANGEPAPLEQWAAPRALRGERVTNAEYSLRRKDTGETWVGSYSFGPIRDQEGTIVGSVVVGRDITERKRAEEEIHRLNTELEQRVVERTAQLEATNKELEAFAYSVSHDLRAPLRGIDGFSQALLEDYADKLDPEGQKYLQRVRAASQRMGRLIDDLLALSRLTRSEMHTERVNLSELAQAIAEELRRAEPGRQVELVIAGGLEVQADASLIRAALENLLGNAWKFTAKHPSARIEVGVEDRHSQPVYFVRDDGAGFDMVFANRLFGAFQRLHTPAEFAGTGIGLATVQRIIHRHGGRIWAEGAVEQGATFYFTLRDGVVKG